MKTVLVIDPVQASVREEQWDGKLPTLYKWIRTEVVQRVQVPKAELWVDEEGLYKLNIPQWFLPELYPTPIVGVGVLVPHSGSDYTADSLNKIMRWGLLMGPGVRTMGNA